MKFTTYNQFTGQISAIYSIDLIDFTMEDYPPFSVEDRQVIEGEYSQEDFYINISTQQAVERPNFETSINKTICIANGIDEIIISSIPTGTELKLTGPDNLTETIDDGSAELTFDIPGNYKVKLNNFPYKELIYTLQVTDENS